MLLVSVVRGQVDSPSVDDDCAVKDEDERHGDVEYKVNEASDPHPHVLQYDSLNGILLGYPAPSIGNQRNSGRNTADGPTELCISVVILAFVSPDVDGDYENEEYPDSGEYK